MYKKQCTKENKRKKVASSLTKLQKVAIARL